MPCCTLALTSALTPYAVLDGARLYKVAARESAALENTSFGCIMGRAARPRPTEQHALCEIAVAFAQHARLSLHTPRPWRRRSEMANTQAIDHLLNQAVHAQDVPGVVAMAATDRGILYESAFGTRELGKDVAMTPDTVVWIASMTKAISAAAAMQLVERGALQ